EAADWVPRLQEEMIRAEVEPLVRSFQPARDSLPAWAVPVAADLAREAEERGLGTIDFATDNPAVFGGYPPLPIDDFWPVFFYRFVGPEGRRGARVNYAGRMREAEARLMPSTWLVLRCPARPASLVGDGALPR